MQFLNRTLPSLEENLALDEALLLDAEAGRGEEVLRTWEWHAPAVVLGSGSRLAQDVDEAACTRSRAPIARRSSGGGTVLLGPGCLCYSLVLSYERDPALADVRPSYGFILHRLCQALEPLRPGVACAGTSDLAVASRKVSGNSQQRKRTHLLHHGTLLYAFDASRVGEYLKMPGRQPDYRAHRTHADFLGNLNVSTDLLMDRLRTAWEADAPVDGYPQACVEQLLREKYRLDAWVRRR